MKNKKSKDRLGERLKTFSADLKMYFEKRVELIMLSTGEYVSGWIAASLLRAAGGILILLGFSFLMVALAIYLGNVLESESLGYLAVAVLLLLCGILFLYLKPKGILNKLQQQFESEVIKAIEQDGIFEHKKIESPEDKSTTISE